MNPALSNVMIETRYEDLRRAAFTGVDRTGLQPHSRKHRRRSHPHMSRRALRLLGFASRIAT